MSRRQALDVLEALADVFDARARGLELEARLWGGDYSAGRLKRLDTHSWKRREILAARRTYNQLRRGIGLPVIHDWVDRPEQTFVGSLGEHQKELDMAWQIQGNFAPEVWDDVRVNLRCAGRDWMIQALCDAELEEVMKTSDEGLTKEHLTYRERRETHWGALAEESLVEACIERIEATDSADNGGHAFWVDAQGHHKVLTAPRAILYTSAPSDYDGFGTATWEDLGEMEVGGRKMPLRQVAILPEHQQWQKERYASGLHLVMDEAQYQQWRDAGWISEPAGAESVEAFPYAVDGPGV